MSKRQRAIDIILIVAVWMIVGLVVYSSKFLLGLPGPVRSLKMTVPASMIGLYYGGGIFRQAYGMGKKLEGFFALSVIAFSALMLGFLTDVFYDSLIVFPTELSLLILTTIAGTLHSGIIELAKHRLGGSDLGKEENRDRHN